MKNASPQIVLLSAPWPLFNRPSIQLGALKAFLRLSLPEVNVKAFHAYLLVAADLGYDLYGPISRRTWLAEIPYAALLYPEQKEELTRFWRTQQRNMPPDQKADLEFVCGRVEAATRRFLDGVSWERTRLAGLSICLGQLTSSLYMAHEIRQRAPWVAMVTGGSSCAGGMGRSLLDSFPDIDYVIGGEGEGPLLHLARSLLEPGAGGPVSPFPGLMTRFHREDNDAVSQVDSLDRLPHPDFQEYFSLLETLPSRARFVPRLPVEISRGCWWRTRGRGTEDRGCRFCNLNLQWRGYRAKSPERAARELDELTGRHRVVSVSFMDNLIPLRQGTALFNGLSSLPREFDLFAEIRATTPVRTLRAMAEAGVHDVQVGVEALSTSLLSKIGKGTTAIENLEIMKRCETPGMPRLTGNLILQFPGSDEEDVSETLRTLEWALPFRPLKAIPFWLGYGSPVWRSPKTYGIRRTFNHSWYAHLFPASILGTLVLMMQGYHGGVRRQQHIWKPVRDRVLAWRTSYEERHRRPFSDPILFFRDGGEFLIIHDRSHGFTPMTHRLEGLSREIYLFCERNRSIARIASRFPRIGGERLIPFLRMMTDKRLMFEEGGRFLSLAVPMAGCACPSPEDREDGRKG